LLNLCGCKSKRFAAVAAYATPQYHHRTLWTPIQLSCPVFLNSARLLFLCCADNPEISNWSGPKAAKQRKVRIAGGDGAQGAEVG
jgi:hypothetical protein